MGAQSVDPLLDLYGPPSRMIINPFFAAASTSFLAPDFLWLNDTGASDATWPDVSGNARDGSQATSDRRPLIVTGAVNGKQVRRFDGSNDEMDTGTVSLPAEWTAFAVAKLAGTPAINGIVSTDSFNSGNRHAQMIRVNGANLDSVAFSSGTPYFASTAASLSAYSVCTARRSSIALQVFLNGVGGAEGSVSGTPTTGTGSIGIGRAFGQSPPGYWAGDIAEVMIYASDLPAPARQAVEDYLGAKYGITITH